MAGGANLPGLLCSTLCVAAGLAMVFWAQTDLGDMRKGIHAEELLIKRATETTCMLLNTSRGFRQCEIKQYCSTKTADGACVHTDLRLQCYCLGWIQLKGGAERMAETLVTDTESSDIDRDRGEWCKEVIASRAWPNIATYTPQQAAGSTSAAAGDDDLDEDRWSCGFVAMDGAAEEGEHPMDSEGDPVIDHEGRAVSCTSGSPGLSYSCVREVKDNFPCVLMPDERLMVGSVADIAEQRHECFTLQGVNHTIGSVLGGAFLVAALMACFYFLSKAQKESEESFQVSPRAEPGPEVDQRHLRRSFVEDI